MHSHSEVTICRRQWLCLSPNCWPHFVNCPLGMYNPVVAEVVWSVVCGQWWSVCPLLGSDQQPGCVYRQREARTKWWHNGKEPLLTLMPSATTKCTSAVVEQTAVLTCLQLCVTCLQWQLRCGPSPCRWSVSVVLVLPFHLMCPLQQHTDRVGDEWSNRNVHFHPESTTQQSGGGTQVVLVAVVGVAATVAFL